MATHIETKNPRTRSSEQTTSPAANATPSAARNELNCDFGTATISVLRNINNPHAQFRDGILRQVLNRIDSTHRGIHESASEVGKAVGNWMYNNLGERYQRMADKAIQQTKDVGPDTASIFIPSATPVAVGVTFLKIRDAANIFHEDPDKGKICRATMALSLADVSTFLYSVSSWTTPMGLLASTVIGNGVKIANALHIVFRPEKPDEPKNRDLLLETASWWAEKPGIKQALNAVLKLTYTLDHGVATSVDSLKENFAPTASQQQKKHGDMLLNKFHELYEEYYPPKQAETNKAMRSYLADQNDTWNIHIIERDKKVIGGFTGFHQVDPKFGKHLYVEQILPPFEKDPVGNMETWKHIRKVAKEIGARRIWLESPRSEILPEGFKELDVLHAQPSLTGKYTGPVGIDATDPKDQLRMSVLTLDPQDKKPTYREYYDVITMGCTSPWADVNDPAWQLLLKNPRDDRQIPTIQAPAIYPFVQTEMAFAGSAA